MSIDIGERTLSMRVAEEIQVLMLRRGIKGKDLARDLGVSAAWVSYRFNGQQAIDLNDLERIAAVLGVDAFEIHRAAHDGTTLRERDWPIGRPLPARRSPVDNRPRGRGRTAVGPRNRIDRDARLTVR